MIRISSTSATGALGPTLARHAERNTKTLRVARERAAKARATTGETSVSLRRYLRPNRLLPMSLLSRPCLWFTRHHLADRSWSQQTSKLQYRRYLIPILYVHPLLLFYILLSLPWLMLLLLAVFLIHRWPWPLDSTTTPMIMLRINLQGGPWFVEYYLFALALTTGPIRSTI